MGFHWIHPSKLKSLLGFVSTEPPTPLPVGKEGASRGEGVGEGKIVVEIYVHRPIDKIHVSSKLRL